MSDTAAQCQKRILARCHRTEKNITLLEMTISNISISESARQNVPSYYAMNARPEDLA